MHKPVRIAIDARLVGAHSTGDSTYWHGLIAGLAELDLPFEFDFFTNREIPSFVPSHPSIRWIRVPGRSSRLWSLVQFPLATRKANANLVHVQYNASPLLKRFVTTVHDVSFCANPEWFHRRDQILLSRFVGSAIRRAQKVITVSRFSEGEILKYFPNAKGKIGVTYLAPSPTLRPQPREVAQKFVREKWGFSDPFLLTVGTRWPRKNMALAIDAAGLLPDTLPHRLIVTGKPGWGDEPRSPRVVETGYVSDHELHCLYSAAEIYLAPSHYEGFGITPLEAMACGTPVICSPGGAQQEIVVPPAVLETSTNPADWAKRIQELLADSSKLISLREAGIRKASEFSWKKMASETLKIYEEAIHD